MQAGQFKAKNSKQKIFDYGSIISLLFLVIFGITQIASSSSYALFTDTTVRKNMFSAAFIFPKTVEEMEDDAEEAAEEAERKYREAREAYKRCKDGDSAAAINNVKLAAEAALAARQAANTAQFTAAALASNAARAQDDVDSLKANLETLRKQTNVNPDRIAEAVAKLRSAERVLSYVRSAFLKARDLSALAGKSAAEAERVASEATRYVLQKQEQQQESEQESKAEQVKEQVKDTVSEDQKDSTVVEEIYEGDDE